MAAFEEIVLDVDGRRTRALRGGAAGGPPVLFLHGGIPGKSLYCGGSHMWGPSLSLFAARGPVLALDLPGAGGSEIGDPKDFGIGGMGRRVLGVIGQLGLDGCHVVGTDVGGLVALWMAMEAPATLGSISIVASHIATPTGDSQENIVLAHPPAPLWSRAAQAWALERLSWARHHIDAALLDGCVANAASPGHTEAVRLVGQGAYEESFVPSVGAAKGRFYALLREGGVAVPAQVVWAEKDPSSRLENGMTLFRLIAEKQGLSQFHVIARAGALPFHEEPEAFHTIVDAFHRGLAAAVAA